MQRYLNSYQINLKRYHSTTLPDFFILISRVFFEEKIQGLDCGDEVGAWLSDFLGLKGLRLVRYLDGMKHRDIHWMGGFKGWDVNSAEGDTVMFICMCLCLPVSRSVSICLYENLPNCNIQIFLTL